MFMYCLTHGRAHYPGENEDVALLGDDYDCIEEEWPVVEGTVLRSQCEPGDTFFFELHPPVLAYLETLSAGMVPVKVTDVAEEGATLRVTAARPGFKRGQEVVVHVPNHNVVSRESVYVKGGRMRSMGPSRFVTAKGDVL